MFFVGKHGLINEAFKMLHGQVEPFSHLQVNVASKTAEKSCSFPRFQFVLCLLILIDSRLFFYSYVIALARINQGVLIHAW